MFFAYYLFKTKTFSLWLFFPIIILQLYILHNEQESGFRHFSSIENHNLINYNLYYFKSSKTGKVEADKWHKSVYDNSGIWTRTDKDGNKWLNLDWFANHPGGKYFDYTHGTTFYIIQEYCNDF